MTTLTPRRSRLVKELEGATFQGLESFHGFKFFQMGVEVPVLAGSGPRAGDTSWALRFPGKIRES